MLFGSELCSLCIWRGMVVVGRVVYILEDLLKTINCMSMVIDLSRLCPIASILSPLGRSCV
jgi:hypothetical protein